MCVFEGPRDSDTPQSWSGDTHLPHLLSSRPSWPTLDRKEKRREEEKERESLLRVTRSSNAHKVPPSLQ